jgi:hypothetical protein
MSNLKNLKVQLNYFKEAEAIKEHILRDESEMIDEALKIIVKEKAEYLGNRFKKWYVFVFGVVLGAFSAYVAR